MKLESVRETQVHSVPIAQGANIGELLLDAGKVSLGDAERVLKLQREAGLRFGEAAIKLGLVTEDDVRQALSLQFDYPYLAAGDTQFGEELLAAYRPFSQPVEGLRGLRTQLLLRWFSTGHRTLALVGANAGDGCSFHAANLAVVFSQLGERTLLIDANLRSPRLHEIFKLGNRPGLSELLAGRCGDEAVVSLDAFLGLSVLTAGAPPPNPTELLTRNQLRRWLAVFGEQYDVILLDTAPSALTGDAGAVAAHAGGVLMIARENQTPMGRLAALKEALAHTQAQVVGAVLNRHR